MKKLIILLISLGLFPLIASACSYQVITHRFSNDFFYYWPYYLIILILIALIILVRKNKIMIVIFSLLIIAISVFFIYHYPIKTEEIHCAENGFY